MTYGGQCSCKPGVGGRTCNHCLPGFYNFTSSGCTRCGCSVRGSVTPVCNNANGECQCKANTEGHKCDQCKLGTYNLDSGNPQGCQHCFGYGHAFNCTSAVGFVARDITTNFVTVENNDTDVHRGWVVVDRSGKSILNTTSMSDGLVVTTPASESELFLSAPKEFLGNRLTSYKKKLNIEMEVMNSTGSGTIITMETTTIIIIIITSNGIDVVIIQRVTLLIAVKNYHLVLDETHVNGSMTPYQFQSLLTNVTSLKVRASYHPQGSVRFRQISMESARANATAHVSAMVRYVEKANCQRNYTGLSCEMCTAGYTREVVGSSPFGRCVLCSCNNRSRECNWQTGVCTNCQVGTHGDHCEQCTNNVQGPDCTSCKLQYWGLNRAGCRPCNCSLPFTMYANRTVCDQVTGQCPCNATVPIGGRVCDRCKENAYNKSASLFDCQGACVTARYSDWQSNERVLPEVHNQKCPSECSTCYSYIQIDVHGIRSQVSRLQTLAAGINSQPVMQHEKTFAIRMSETAQAVWRLVLRTLLAIQNERALDIKLASLTREIEKLQNLLSTEMSSRVNQTLELGSRVTADHRNISTTMNNTNALIQEGYRLVNTTFKLQSELLQRRVQELNRLALKIGNLTTVASDLENATVYMNTTIHVGVDYAVRMAELAGENARVVQTTAQEFSPLLQPLLRNVTRVKEAGNQTLMLGEGRLKSATDLLNHTNVLATRARQQNPANSQVVKNLKSRADQATNTSAKYISQTMALFSSSLPVIAEVETAIDRARKLGTNVSVVLQNATETRRDTLSTLQTANDAISTGSKVHSDATEMLRILKDFSGVAERAQIKANLSLAKTREIERQSSQYISNATAVNASIQDSASLSRRAVEQGNIAKRHAEDELKAMTTAHLHAQMLRNQTLAAEELVANQTVREFIRREIQPVQNVCLNISNSAKNVSSVAEGLFRRAKEANRTALRLLEVVQRIANESSSIPPIVASNIPRLKSEIESVRQNYTAHNVTSRIEQLQRDLEAHRVVTRGYTSRIGMLESAIRKLKQFNNSLKNVLTQCSQRV